MNLFSLIKANTVQTKIIFILLLIISASIMGSILLKISQNNKVNRFFAEEAGNQQRHLDEYMKLDGSALQAYAYDYSYWDDMIDFVKNKNYEWARQNIDESFRTYKANAAWVYDTTLNIVYFSSNLDDRNIYSQVLQKQEIEALLRMGFFNHFYKWYGDGPMEINCAPIQPSADSPRKTPPSGYLFVGKLWNKEQIEKFSENTGTEIGLYRESKNVGSALKFDSKKGLISIEKRLNGWDGKTVAWLESISTHSFVTYINNSSNAEFELYIIFSLIIIIIISFSLVYMVGAPLKTISRSLDSNDKNILANLRDSRSEFGRIASLIDNSFDQKATLENEIKDRKNAEKALIESENKYRRVIEASPVVFWSQSAITNEFFIISDAIKNITGYSADEIIETPSLIQSIIHPNDAKIWQNHLDALLNEKDSKNFEIGFIHKNGAIKMVSVWLTPIIDNDGKLSRIDGVGMDITDKKMLEQKIIQTEKMAAIGLLAAGVAHEFNNLLCGITGNLSFVQSNFSDSEICRKSVSDAINASDRAEELIRSLLSYSRANVDEMTDVRIDDIIKNLLKLVDKEIIKANINLTTDFRNVPTIRGVPGQLQQVFLNILINSLHAVKDSGIISIYVWSCGERVYVEISDNGVGINKELMNKIFDPFFSTKSNIGDKKAEGTGLGLSISYNIIKNHGGDIMVKSEPGVGTEFTVILPIRSLPKINDFDVAFFKNANALIVEFDKEHCKKAAEMIAALGGESVQCVWSDDAISHLANESFDYVILDASHPAMIDFVRLFDYIKENHSDLPVILASSGPLRYQYDEYAKKADGLIFKPYSRDIFAKIISGLHFSRT